MCRASAARMCPVAGSPVDGLSVVNSTATCARAASRNSSTDAARGPNSAASVTSARNPAASTAVPCRSVWIRAIVKGNSLPFARNSRTSARPTLPYPIIASFKVRLYPDLSAPSSSKQPRSEILQVVAPRLPFVGERALEKYVRNPRLFQRFVPCLVGLVRSRLGNARAYPQQLDLLAECRRIRQHAIVGRLRIGRAHAAAERPDIRELVQMP